MIERFEITPIDLEKEKIESVQEGYIEFYEKYVIHVASFFCETPIDIEDDNLGNHVVKRLYKMAALKTAISGSELHYLENAKCYCVYLNIMGANDDIKCYFKKYSDANKLFTFALNEYLLK